MGLNMVVIPQVYDPFTKKWMCVKLEGTKFVLTPTYPELPDEEDDEEEGEEYRFGPISKQLRAYFAECHAYGFTIEKDYAFFAQIAGGLCGEGYLFSRKWLPIKGLPPNLDHTVRDHLTDEEYDMENHSWISGTEFEALKIEYPKEHFSFTNVRAYHIIHEKLNIKRVEDLEKVYQKYRSSLIPLPDGMFCTWRKWMSMDDKLKMEFLNSNELYYVGIPQKVNSDRGGWDQFKDYHSRIKAQLNVAPKYIRYVFAFVA